MNVIGVNAVTLLSGLSAILLPDHGTLTGKARLADDGG
jgi:hypothetical protein